MSDNFLAALSLSRNNQHISQQDDAPTPVPVKEKKSEDSDKTYVPIKRKAVDPIPNFLPLKSRKAENPGTSSQTQLFRPLAIAHKHEVTPRPGPSNHSEAFTDKVKRRVRKKLLCDTPRLIRRGF